jgi:hypothetical protein
MYLVRVESSTRDEIGAAAAAHAELGRDYDHAVAEGLIERIGAEIDKRVDAKLESPSGKPVRRRRPGNFASMVMALGSMGLGVGATAVVLSDGASRSGATATVMVLVIWIAIAMINGMYNNRN